MVAVRSPAHGVREPFERRPPEVNAILGPVESMYEDAKSAMRQLALVANESMAFYLGYHWGQPTEMGFEVDTGERQETYNYIQATVRAWTAANLRALPAPQVAASNSSFDSMIRARNSQRLVRSMVYNGTLPFEELVRGEIDCAVKGAVWYKVTFDPNAGRLVTVPEHVQQPDELGNVQWLPTGRSKKVFSGAVKIEARDIIDVLPDPNATREEEVDYLFERKLISRYRLEARFPYDAFGMPTKGRFSGAPRDEMMEQRDLVERMTRGVPLYSQGGRAPENELCEMVCYWEKPNPARIEGRLLCWVGDVILADGPLPYEWPWILRNGQNIVPNSLYAIGTVHPLKSPQRTLNLNASKKSEIMDRVMQVYMLADYDSDLSIEGLDDISGRVVYHAAGHNPQWMEPPNIPSSMFDLESGLLNIIRDISSFHEISQGDAPPQIETGRGLAYLFEFQQGVRQPEVALFKHTVVRMLSKSLRLIRDYYPEDRLLELLGENEEWTLRAFKREQYDLDASILIVPDGDTPNSPALKNAMATEYFQLGALEDTPGAERFRKIVRFDWGEGQRLDDRERQYDRAFAQIERVRLDPTYPLVAEERDDPLVFLDVLDQFRASPEYDALIPIARTSLDQYVAQFEMRLQLQQANFAQQQAMFSGGGAGPGAPPPADPGMESPPDGGFSDAEGVRVSGNPGANQEPIDEMQPAA